MFRTCYDDARGGAISNTSKSRIRILEAQDMENPELGKTNDNVLIRDFRKSDLNAFLELFPMCFAKEFEISGFDPDHIAAMVNRGFGRTGRLILGLLRLFGKEPIKFLVAEVGGKVVGTTIINDRGKSGYISVVMVHPDYRRRGIATRLMTDALNYIRRGRKKARAVLYVDSTNASAKSVYVKLEFKTFEHSAYFVKETNPLHAPENASEVTIREFQKDDLDHVYNLIKASEDSNSLRIFDFKKKDLKGSLLERMFRFATQKKLVAVQGGRIVGYAEASYTTPKETGRIGSITVNSEYRSLGIEKLLIEAAMNEIAKIKVSRIRIVATTAKRELIEAVKDLGFREVLVMEAMVKEFQ
jgi:ribosomal protein S18 acetylase RimI-like enzyme